MTDTKAKIEAILNQFAYDTFKLGELYGKREFPIMNPWITYMPTGEIEQLIIAERLDELEKLDTNEGSHGYSKLYVSKRKRQLATVLSAGRIEV